MAIKVIKIICGMGQGDVKVGLPHSMNDKNAIVSKEVVKLLDPPVPSARMEYLSSQGKGDEATRIMSQYGYLRFTTVAQMLEFGLIDPNYNGGTKKVATLLYDPNFYKTPTEFAKGVNDLRLYIEKRIGRGAFEDDTIMIAYDGNRPYVLKHDLKGTDIDPTFYDDKKKKVEDGE